MSKKPHNGPVNPAQQRMRIVALVGMVLAIAIAVWVSNGGTRQNGSTHEPDAVIKFEIDSMAQGELAAFRGTAGGESFPEIRFTSEDGEIVGFDYFEGKVTLVNFWATWCAPCRAEMPSLDALHAKYADQGFQVATINLDTGADGINKAKAFMDEVGLKNLPLHSDPTFEAFEVLKKRGRALGLPATLLLGPDGHEWGVMAGPAEWNSPDAHNVVEAALRMAKN